MHGDTFGSRVDVGVGHVHGFGIVFWVEVSGGMVLMLVLLLVFVLSLKASVRGGVCDGVGVGIEFVAGVGVGVGVDIGGQSCGDPGPLCLS